MTTIPDTERRTVYSPVAATTSFAVGFVLFEDDDIEIIIDGAVHTDDDWTVSASYSAGQSTDAVVLVDSPGWTGDVQIVGRRAPYRTNQFTSGAPVTIDDLNSIFNQQAAVDRELFDRLGRALQHVPGDAGAPFDAGGRRVAGLAAGVDGSDAVTLDQAEALVDAEALARAYGDAALQDAIDAEELAREALANRALLHDGGSGDPFDAGERRITDLAEGTEADDAATVGQMEAADAAVLDTAADLITDAAFDASYTVASEAEAVAGEVNNRAMTPLRTRQAVEGRLQGEGGAFLANTGETTAAMQAVTTAAAASLLKTAQIITGPGIVTPRDFGWQPGDDVAGPLRDCFDACADSTRFKEILLSRDPSDPDGHYRAYTPSPLTNNRCIYLDDAAYNGIVLRGLGRDATRIKYDHAEGLVNRSILSASGVDLSLIGLSFDSREQDRIPVAGVILDGDLSDSATSITVNDASGLPSVGHIKVDDEWIGYAGKSTNTLTGVVRGIRGTFAAAHTNGTAVIFLVSSGHHTLGIDNFRRLRIVDVGVYNSPFYGIGIQNTNEQYLEHLEIDHVHVQNTASDAIDIKCPVTNGNKFARISNIVIEGWARENGWVTSADNGLDLRLPGASIVNADFIFTPYMGGSIACGVRTNQAGDFSGGQFSTWTNIHVHGVPASGFGTKVPVHTGATVSDAVFVNFVAMNLTGSALSLYDRARVDSFKIYGCDRAVRFNGVQSVVSNGDIQNCTNEAVYDMTNTGGRNVAHNVRAQDNDVGFRASTGGSMILRDCVASGNTPDEGVTNRDYLLVGTCFVEKSPGAHRTVTANYTATEDDYIIFVDTTSGNVTVTLPHAVRCVPGREFVIIKTVAANTVTINCATIQINGGSNITMADQWSERRCISNGVSYIARVA